MTYHGIDCGLMAHHGHSLLCTLGVFVDLFTFGLAAEMLEELAKLAKVLSWATHGIY
jgi:hypothetical protein